MVLSAFLSANTRIKISTVSLSLGLITIILPSSSSFSTQCKVENFSRPIPKKVPFTVSAHGMKWQDPYHWMQKTNDPDFVTYLNQENSYSQAFMADTKNLQTTLVSEMKNRMPSKVSTPPERWGHWLYYQYIPEGKEYPILCRRLGNDKSRKTGWLKNLLHRGTEKEEILLDWNQIAKQYGYVHVGSCRVSPDHNFLAYTLDITGDEQFRLQIKDLRDGLVVPRSQVDGVVSLAWAQDSKSLFYTVSDENQRPYRVLYTNLASNETDDIVVFTESDSSFCVDITSTKDGKFVTVNSNSRTSSEVYVINATNPLSGLQKIRKRVPNVQYFVEHHNGYFYILTNAPLSGKNKWYSGGYYLATCRVEDIDTSDWQIVIHPEKDMTIQDMDIFNEHMVLFLNRKGNPGICSINLPVNTNFKRKTGISNLNPWHFPLPSSSCSIAPGSNHDFMNSMYRVVLSSPVIPDMIVDYDLSKRTFVIVQQEDIKKLTDDANSNNPIVFAQATCNQLPAPNNMAVDGNYANLDRWKDFSDEYICEKKEVTSQDGVDVPLTILYSRKSWKRGRSPGLLLAYGSYGEVLDKSWCSNRLSLLDRGWVVAFADVRGGGGGADTSWHKSGSGLFKQNSVYDFVSCGSYLFDNGYIHRHQLGAIGNSAGCVILGAAMNMQPDLLRAAILKVPFLDTLNTLLDPNLPLTILDYEEFGNPQIESEFRSILSYSPYENITADACHPSVLVTPSFQDSRVGVWEGAKWVAKIRDITCSTCSRSVILKTNMTGGHFGEGGRYTECEETAYDYAFLMKAMGMKDQHN